MNPHDPVLVNNNGRSQRNQKLLEQKVKTDTIKPEALIDQVQNIIDDQTRSDFIVLMNLMLYGKKEAKNVDGFWLVTHWQLGSMLQKALQFSTSFFDNLGFPLNGTFAVRHNRLT